MTTIIICLIVAVVAVIWMRQVKFEQAEKEVNELNAIRDFVHPVVIRADYPFDPNVSARAEILRRKYEALGNVNMPPVIAMPYGAIVKVSGNGIKDMTLNLIGISWGEYCEIACKLEVDIRRQYGVSCLGKKGAGIKFTDTFLADQTPVEKAPFTIERGKEFEFDTVKSI